MTFLEIKNIEKHYNDFTALGGVSFSMPRGQVITLLGPSGCGKTTLLRTIAGLETADRGAITLDGRTLLDTDAKTFLAPERRGIGMVFQSYALWPHLTVGANIGLGLKLKGMDRAKIEAKTAEVLQLVGLPATESRFPSSMSGGQQQRVSLARALALEPACILFDEPLSNLDVLLRDRMRFEIRELLKAQGITAIYVTHDQSEAMVISDIVLIMNKGSLVQTGAPKELYTSPKTRFVAEFFGRTNILQINADKSTSEMIVTVEGIAFERTHPLKGQQGSLLGFRPENVTISASPKEGQMSGTLMRLVYLGGTTQIEVNVHGNVIVGIVKGVPNLEIGSQIGIGVAEEDLMILEEDQVHE
jgi:iron(III) transport system ATP-binding protein